MLQLLLAFNLNGGKVRASEVQCTRNIHPSCGPLIDCRAVVLLRHAFGAGSSNFEEYSMCTDHECWFWLLTMQVRAGARVLCHGGSDKTRVEGIVSSEMVHVRLPSKNLVFGFNDEKPFFTSGHVFHTTTGLRAIDPEAAVEENPWMQVSSLGLGPCCYASNPSSTFNLHSIQKLNISSSCVRLQWQLDCRCCSCSRCNNSVEAQQSPSRLAMFELEL